MGIPEGGPPSRSSGWSMIAPTISRRWGSFIRSALIFKSLNCLTCHWTPSFSCSMRRPRRLSMT